MIKYMTIAGFGGQGVITVGKMLGQIAFNSSMHSIFVPSLGSEQRGGTASCSVVVSDTEIWSPVMKEADVLVAFNEPSLHKFLPKLKKNGILICNTSRIKAGLESSDYLSYGFDIEGLADKIGYAKVANVIMLGAVCGILKLFAYNSVEEAVIERFAGEPELIAFYKKALEIGYNAAML